MAPSYIYQPFRTGPQSGVAVTDSGDRHLTDKIMAILFTAPGERVNEPDFGVGLNQVLFESLDDANFALLELRVRAGLERDLGDEIELLALALQPEPDHGLLRLLLDYRRLDESRTRLLEVEL